MVQKCGYLPLAISVLGGILGEKKSFDAWELVNEDIDLYLRRGTGNDGDGAIQQVLSLSYDDLPYHLKPCFLYLSRFQEDESIRAEDLYLLWMAEGIVSPRDQEKEETLMDVIKRSLSELASRSMVQVQVDEILAPEEFESCRLHDLLRDLCLVKSVEEEFLNVIDFRGGKRPSLNSSSASSCLRRLAVYMDLNLDGVSLIGESTQQLRSLLLHVPLDYSNLLVLPQGVIDFENFEFLRVLNFENLDFEGKKLPEGLSKLIHLRLLGFRCCGLQELPSCIGDFPLELGFFGSPEIPNVLWKINRLKYLYLPSHNASAGKVVLSGLNELEMIHGFNSLFCEITDLSKLKSLRRLQASIYGNENLSKFIDCIEVNGKSLETTVRIYDCDFMSEEGKILLRKLFMSCRIQDIFIPGRLHIDKLPEYEPGFFPNLTDLYLQGVQISKDPMSTLEKLPNLRSLNLVHITFVGKEMICHANGFPQLRKLGLVLLLGLEKWRVEEGAMPRLLRLILAYCKKLEMIPEGLRFITTLQTLAISRMSKEFKNRIREGGEDFDKVRHVNSIITIDHW